MNLAGGELSTSTTACNPSSARFKQNVSGIKYGLPELLAMRPVGYTYKPEMMIPGQQVGFIAEEMDSIIPEVVGHDAQGLAANIDYAKLAPVIVKAIQDMQSAVSTENAPTTTPSLMIDGSGNLSIGMGTATVPQYKLAVQGDVAATSFVNISTRDAKTNISYLDDAAKDSILSSINGLGIAQYRYKTENQTDPLRLGLIAEEAPAAVLAVGGKGVDVYKLSTYTLAGIQAQQRQIIALKNAQSSTELTVSSTTKAAADAQITIFDLVGLTKSQGEAITAIQTRLDTLASRVDSLATSTAAMSDRISALQAELTALSNAMTASQNAAITTSDASTTAVAGTVATSTIQSMFAAVEEWTMNKLSAKIIYADRIEAKTVAVTQGFDITDQASGVIWCVTVKNGEWSKVPWACGTPAQNVAAAAGAQGATLTEPINQASTINVPQNDTPAPSAPTSTVTTTVITPITSGETPATTTPIVTEPAPMAGTTASSTQSVTATSTEPVATSTPAVTTAADQGSVPPNSTTTSPTASTTISISMEVPSTASTTTP
jgi:chaperonin cofactor prefoldin